MLKKAKYYVITLFVCLLVACGTVQYPVKPTYEEYGTIMVNAFEDYYTKAQFDSICQTDTISANLKDWYMIPLRDSESKENVSQYMYIKRLGNNESIYRLQEINKNRYKITKRITR